LLALTLTQPNVSTLPVLLNKFPSTVEDRLFASQAAISTLITLPMAVFSILIQKAPDHRL
jgi:ABC-type maltose transport system permease subunit